MHSFLLLHPVQVDHNKTRNKRKERLWDLWLYNVPRYKYSSEVRQTNYSGDCRPLSSERMTRHYQDTQEAKIPFHSPNGLNVAGT